MLARSKLKTLSCESESAAEPASSESEQASSPGCGLGRRRDRVPRRVGGVLRVERVVDGQVGGLVVDDVVDFV